MNENKFGLVLQELEQVLGRISHAELEKLAEMIIEAKKVFVVGVGRVLLAMMAGVKRFNHLDVEAYYVGQIDEPAATDKDLLIVASNSGESVFPVAVVQKAKQLHVRIAYIGGNAHSICAKMADLAVVVPTASKLGNPGVSSAQPMTTLFEQSLLLICDVLALLIIEKKQLNVSELWDKHANLE